MKIMVFDVGGTEIKYSVMDEQMHRTDSGAVPTPQDTQELLESRGLRVAFTGKGAVREQTLPPGAKIQRGQTVTLKLR